MTHRNKELMLERLNERCMKKLVQNDSKNDWKEMATGLLFKLLKHEVEELKIELMFCDSLDNVEAIMDECADVANFAGFIIDKLMDEKKEGIS